MLCLLNLCESKGRVPNLAPKLFDWRIVTVRLRNIALHSIRLGRWFVSVCVCVCGRHLYRNACRAGVVTMKRALVSQQWCMKGTATQICVCYVGLGAACCAAMAAQLHTTCAALERLQSLFPRGSGFALNAAWAAEVGLTCNLAAISGTALLQAAIFQAAILQAAVP